ncbi:MAG: hypothetical protein WCK74_09990 [Gemmatimonadaceae bacterium]
MSVEELVAQLQAALGSSLVGVVLYGSAAVNAQVAGHSDLNVLVIAETLPVEQLRILGQTARAWGEAGQAPPLMLTRREWEGSADVFPMEYADILERHRVLAGTLPLEGIAVQAADLRLQVEQEALGKLLRLRRAITAAGTDVARQRELLKGSSSAFQVILRSLLRLLGEQPPADAAAMLARIAERTGLTMAPFLRVQQVVRGEAVSDTEVPVLVAAYLDGADALSRYIDQLAI